MSELTTSLLDWAPPSFPKQPDFFHSSLCRKSHQSCLLGGLGLSPAPSAGVGARPQAPVCLPAGHLSRKPPIFGSCVPLPLCGPGGPKFFPSEWCHYSEPFSSGRNTGEATPHSLSTCQPRAGCPGGGSALRVQRGLKWTRQQMCVSPDVGGREDVSEEQKQLFLLQRANDQVSKLAFSGIGQRLCLPGPGTHPTIQEGLKVTRGRHQVGPREVSWETGNEEGRVVCVKS